MKKISLLSILFVLLSSNIVRGEQPVITTADATAEDRGKLQKYMRSSLATMMVIHPEDEFGQAIQSAFLEIPIPEKYNNHDIGYKSISNENLPVPGKRKPGLYKAKYGKSLSKREIARNGQALENVVNEADFAKMFVAKWFNLQGDDISDAFFDMERVKERGLYNATVLDVELAAHTVRGLAMLSDAGEELIGNTYLLINDMTYVTAEERAAAAKISIGILGALLDGLTGGTAGRDMYNASAAIADSYTGFTVKNHSYLMRLVWNDSIASVFYNNYYTSVPDSSKIHAFLNDSTTFKMKYVAHEYEDGSKTAAKGTSERSDLAKIACTRSMDNNIAALQLQYEDFKVKTPITGIIYDDKGRVTGYAAQIGLKEGVTEDSKFQVLNQKFNEETNQTEYVRVATLKPVKGKVWDNRYMAFEDKEKGSDLEYTTFKKVSGGDIYPGMLIIEGKYRKARTE